AILPVGKFVYVAGGIDFIQNVPCASFEYFDTTANTWTILPNMRNAHNSFFLEYSCFNLYAFTEDGLMCDRFYLMTRTWYPVSCLYFSLITKFCKRTNQSGLSHKSYKNIIFHHVQQFRVPDE